MSLKIWNNYIEDYLKKKYHNMTPLNIPKVNKSIDCAVIVELRNHEHLETILKNTIFYLPSFSLHIFHGNNNEEYLKNIIKDWINVKLTNINKSNLVKADYSKLLKSKWFYDQIDSENILIFQTDVILLKNNIDQFLKYDYIGAPWRNSGSTFGIKVGNGGLSFRKKSKMLYIIENATQNISSEDVFFSYHCKKFGFNVPSVEIAKTFSVETIYYDNPFGLHKSYYFLEEHKIKKLLSKDEKYVYCPFRNGMGLNNRRQILEFCILISFVLNRTLILNRNYAKSIHINIDVDITDIWNIDKLREMINVKLIDSPLSLDKNEIHYISSPYNRKFNLKEYCDNTYNKKYILLGGMFTWLHLLTCINLDDELTFKVMQLKNKYFSFCDKILNLANLIKDKINEDYISVHIRKGDMQFRPISTLVPVDSDIFEIMESVDINLPVLVCTNKRENDEITNFCKKYKTIFVSDICDIQINHNELCCIEMLLCTNSKIHIPSLHSSWDDYVLSNRKDDINLLKLWIDKLNKHLNCDNKINHNLFYKL